MSLSGFHRPSYPDLMRLLYDSDTLLWTSYLVDLKESVERDIDERRKTPERSYHQSHLGLKDVRLSPEVFVNRFFLRLSSESLVYGSESGVI